MSGRPAKKRGPVDQLTNVVFFCRPRRHSDEALLGEVLAEQSASRPLDGPSDVPVDHPMLGAIRGWRKLASE